MGSRSLGQSQLRLFEMSAAARSTELFYSNCEAAAVCVTGTAVVRLPVKAVQHHVHAVLLQVVHAQMVIWVAAVVLFTLTVNAPALGPLMTALGLNKPTPAQRHMHR